MEQPPNPTGADDPDSEARQMEGSSPEQRISIRTAAELLAAVPYLLGFHPGDGDMVILGSSGPRRRVQLALRYDLGNAAEGFAEHTLDLLQQNHVDSVALLGYGVGEQVTPIMDSLRVALGEAQMTIYEALRVENQRYWSYIHDQDLNTSGMPIEDPASRVSAEMVLAGLSAFRNRSELVQLIEPSRLVPDEVLQQVRAEWQELSEHGIRQAVQAGRQHVREALRLARQGARIDDREVAWLAVAMQHIAVRDDAWAHMEPTQRFAHQSFWIDVVQRTPDGLIAAPGSLLAFVAWQCGNGALANIALSRVGRADASYSMAGLIFQALQSGMPPSAATPPMTPDEVAASYEETLRDF